jgi:hypothetical protein
MVQYILAYKDENGTIHSYYFRSATELNRKRREVERKGYSYERVKRVIEYPCANIKTVAL